MNTPQDQGIRVHASYTETVKFVFDKQLPEPANLFVAEAGNVAVTLSGGQKTVIPNFNNQREFSVIAVHETGTSLTIDKIRLYR